ncbi:hypothetical protein [Hydrogenophaga sp. T2]|uniref:hypothetical protein n=1 Tax=Hydrogenophaga sp. T2 TaxID=3132823 RepID=UPI003CEB518B
MCDMRKAFEAWAGEAGYDTAHAYDTERSRWVFWNPMTHDLWQAWQAARKPQWLPIESAPTEHGLYLVRIGGQTHIAQFNPQTVSAKWWRPYGMPERLHRDPTHWMPLPAAPDIGEGEGK